MTTPHDELETTGGAEGSRMIWQKARSVEHPERECWVSNYGLHYLEDGEVGWGYDAPYLDLRDLLYFIPQEAVELIAEFSDKVRRSRRLPAWVAKAQDGISLPRPHG